MMLAIKYTVKMRTSPSSYLRTTYTGYSFRLAHLNIDSLINSPMVKELYLYILDTAGYEDRITLK